LSLLDDLLYINFISPTGSTTQIQIQNVGLQ